MSNSFNSFDQKMDEFPPPFDFVDHDTEDSLLHAGKKDRSLDVLMLCGTETPDSQLDIEIIAQTLKKDCEQNFQSPQQHVLLPPPQTTNQSIDFLVNIASELNLDEDFDNLHVDAMLMSNNDMIDPMMTEDTAMTGNDPLFQILLNNQPQFDDSMFDISPTSSQASSPAHEDYFMPNPTYGISTNQSSPSPTTSQLPSEPSSPSLTANFHFHYDINTSEDAETEFKRRWDEILHLPTQGAQFRRALKYYKNRGVRKELLDQMRQVRKLNRDWEYVRKVRNEPTRKCRMRRSRKFDPTL